MLLGRLDSIVLDDSQDRLLSHLIFAKAQQCLHDEKGACYIAGHRGSYGGVEGRSRQLRDRVIHQAKDSVFEFDPQAGNTH